MTDDMEFAERVHYAFLPRHYERPSIEIHLASRPLERVGGDYCSILPVDDARTLVNICDATGHGLAAALFAARVNTFVLAAAHRDPRPCVLIDALNRFLCAHLPAARMHASFGSALFDNRTGQMTFAGAGHPPALLVRKDGEVEQITSSTVMLGIADPLPVACEVHQIEVGSGDRVVFYTDGLLDRRRPDGSRADLDDLVEWLQLHRTLPGTALTERLAEDGIGDGSVPVDDALVIAAALR